MADYFLAFIFGAILGSFINVLVLRLNTGESIVYSASRCFSCNKKLKWFELVPIFSFLLLRGKCSGCGSKISWQYPIVEITSGLLFLLIFNYQLSIVNQFSLFLILNSLFVILFWYLLFAASLYDFKHKILPPKLVYSAIAAAFLFLILEYRIWDLFGNWNLEIGNSVAGFTNILLHLASGAVLFLFFAVIWFVSKGQWMGLGDAKIAFAFGVFLGWIQSAVGFILSFWIGSLMGIILYLFSKKMTFKTAIPFGPFMFLGFFIAYLWGEKLLYWYLNLLGASFL